MIMENHVLIVRYNFIRERIIYSQSILFDDIRTVVFGPCSYPAKSLMGYGRAVVDNHPFIVSLLGNICTVA